MRSVKALCAVRSALLGALNPPPIRMESWASGASLPLPGLLSFLFDALVHGLAAGWRRQAAALAATVPGATGGALRRKGFD